MCAHAATRVAVAARLIELSTASPPAASRSTVRGHRGVRGHRPEHRRLRPEHRDIGQAVTAQRKRPGQVQDHLALVMDRVQRQPRSTVPGTTPGPDGPVTRAVWTNKVPPEEDARGSVPATNPGSDGRPTRLSRRVHHAVIALHSE